MSAAPLSREFWSANSDYLFRSCWPGAEQLLSLFLRFTPGSAADAFLDAGCGPGDYARAASRAGAGSFCVGVDFALPGLQAAMDRTRRHEIESYARIWGTLFGLWISGRIGVDHIVAVADAVNPGHACRTDDFPELRQLLLDRLQRFSLASHHSLLAQWLAARGLGSGRQALDRLRIVTRAYGLDVAPEPVVELQRSSDPVFVAADILHLPFRDNAFSRILICELEPLVGRRSPRWMSEVFRVCDSGGLVMYAGARVPPWQNSDSMELARVRAAMQSQRHVTVIDDGRHVLASGWDPVFNDRQWTDHILTPCLIAMKR